MSATNKLVRTKEVAHGDCSAVDDTVAILGEKWTLLIMGALRRRPTLRYNELERAVDGISQRMLTLTLKKLEQNGLVKRTMFATVPPRVEYELTPLAHTLLAPIKALLDWTLEHRPAMAEARRTYARASKNTA